MYVRRNDCATHAGRITGDMLPTSRSRSESSVSRHVARTPGELIHGGTARVERKRNNSDNHNNNNNNHEPRQQRRRQRERRLSGERYSSDFGPIRRGGRTRAEFFREIFSENGRRLGAIRPILSSRAVDGYRDSVNATKSEKPLLVKYEIRYSPGRTRATEVIRSDHRYS